MTSNVDFHLQQLHPLVGGTITALARTGPGEDAFDEIESSLDEAKA